MYVTRHRGITRAVTTALLIAAPMGIACRDAPVSPQPTRVPAPTLAVAAAVTEDVALLRALVAQLERDGILTAGQANALTSKIDVGTSRLEAGREKPAGNVLGAFINQVNAFVKARLLTAKQAQPLLDAG